MLKVKNFIMFGISKFGYWNLFEIWILFFGIYLTTYY